MNKQPVNKKEVLAKLKEKLGAKREELNKKEILNSLRKRLKERGATKEELNAIGKHFESLTVLLKESRSVSKIEQPVTVENLATEITRLIKEGLPVTNLKEPKDFPKEMDVTMKKPEWYTAPPTEIEVKNVVKVEPQDQTPVLGLVAEMFGQLITFLGKLSNKIFMVRMPDESYLKPQTVALYNPYTKEYIDPDKLFNIVNIAPPNISVAGGGASAVNFKGSSLLGSDTLTVTTAGTRVNLPNIPCSRVTIQSHETNAVLTNGGAIVIGGSNVVAASGTRKGYAIYATQAQTFNVANANMLWIDSVDNGAIITYTYEV